jgi:phosphatidylglycerol---prolipoprotein diacylglyceryl transferase
VTSAAGVWQNPAVLAAWLHTLDPFVFRVGEIGPRWYGLSYVLSALIGYWLYRRLALRGYTDLPAAKVADFITWVGLFGVLLGGRLGWILIYGVRQQHAPGDRTWWLRIWEGGMASHGGILGIVIVTYILAKRWKVSWTSIGDTLCVVSPIGLFLVRCANFINGELYGHKTDSALAVKFPTEIFDQRNADVAERVYQAAAPVAGIVEKYGGPDTPLGDKIVAAAQDNPAVQAAIEPVLTPRHPSQIYEALLEGAVLFVILYFLRTRVRVPRGMLTGLFFVLYAALRIVGEIFRVPDAAWRVGPFSAGQFLSLFMFFVGAAFIIVAWRRQEYEAADRRG